MAGAQAPATIRPTDQTAERRTDQKENQVMWDRLLRNARVVDPVNGRDGVMDVAVKDGRIAAVGPNLQGEA